MTLEGKRSSPCKYFTRMKMSPKRGGHPLSSWKLRYLKISQNKGSHFGGHPFGPRMKIKNIIGGFPPHIYLISHPRRCPQRKWFPSLSSTLSFWQVACIHLGSLLTHFLFKEVSPPHLGYTLTPTLLLMLSFFLLLSFPCYCLGHSNFQPFGFGNQNLWRNLVSIVLIDDLLPCLRSYTSLVGQGSILICFGKISGICIP